jgi:hypothetical protein
MVHLDTRCGNENWGSMTDGAVQAFDILFDFATYQHYRRFFGVLKREMFS